MHSALSAYICPGPSRLHSAARRQRARMMRATGELFVTVAPVVEVTPVVSLAS